MRRKGVIELRVGDTFKNHLGRIRRITHIECQSTGVIRVRYETRRNGAVVRGACDRSSFVSWARSAQMVDNLNSN